MSTLTGQVELPPSGRDPREGTAQKTFYLKRFFKIIHTFIESRGGEIESYTTALFNSSFAIAEEFPALEASEEAAMLHASMGTKSRAGSQRSKASVPRIPASWGGGFKTDKRLSKKPQVVQTQVASSSVFHAVSAVQSAQHQTTSLSSSMKSTDKPLEKSSKPVSQYAAIAENTRTPRVEDFPALSGGTSDSTSRVPAQDRELPRPPPPPPPPAPISSSLEFGVNIKVKFKPLTFKAASQASTGESGAKPVSGVTVEEKKPLKAEKKSASAKIPPKMSDLSRAISNLGLNSGLNYKATKKVAGISAVIPAKSIPESDRVYESSGVASTLKSLKSELRQPKISSVPPSSVAAFKDSERISNQNSSAPPGLSKNAHSGTGTAKVGWVKIGGASQTIAAESLAAISGSGMSANKLSAFEYPSLSESSNR